MKSESGAAQDRCGDARPAGVRLTSIALVCAGALLLGMGALLSSGWPARAQGSGCVGDCSGDGQVTVEELLTLVNIALGIESLSDCQGSDTNQDQQITVDEILAAVSNALGGCPTPPPTATPLLTGTNAIEGSSGTLIQIIDFGLAGNPGGTGDAAPEAIARRSAACAESSCVTLDRTSTRTITYANCISTDQFGNTTTANGVIATSTIDFNLCVTPSIPDDVSYSEAYRQFTTMVTNPDGALIRSLVQDETIHFGPRTQGCAGPNERLVVDGMLSAFDTAPPKDEVLRFHNLIEDLQSSGTPCVRQNTLNGGLDIENHTTGERVSQVFHHLLLTWATVGDNLFAVTVTGSMAQSPSVFTDCFGGADFETVEALRIDLTGQILCPTAGLVQVTLPGSVSRFQYTPNGGVQFDFNADGKPDRIFDRCDNPDLVLCRGPVVGVP